MASSDLESCPSETMNPDSDPMLPPELRVKELESDMLGSEG